MKTVAKNAASLIGRAAQRHGAGFATGALVMTGAALIPALWGGAGRDWVMTSLPAWLEALGTVGACALAWGAYRNWRKQEAARRKADVAEKVVQSASILASTMRDARFSGFGLVDLNETNRLEAYVSETADEQRTNVVEATIRPAAELRSYLALIQVYFGGDARRLVEALVDRADTMREAMNTINAAADGHEPPEYSWDTDLIIGHLKAVGVCGTSEEFRAENEAIMAAAADIERRLQPFMRYDEVEGAVEA